MAKQSIKTSIIGILLLLQLNSKSKIKQNIGNNRFIHLLLYLKFPKLLLNVLNVHLYHLKQRNLIIYFIDVVYYPIATGYIIYNNSQILKTNNHEFIQNKNYTIQFFFLKTQSSPKMHRKSKGYPIKQSIIKLVKYHLHGSLSPSKPNLFAK